VLLQNQGSGEWKPITLASHLLNETEKRCAQIEKKLWLQRGLMSSSLII